MKSGRGAEAKRRRGAGRIGDEERGRAGARGERGVYACCLCRKSSSVLRHERSRG
jgi:hypothetical protein